MTISAATKNHKPYKTSNGLEPTQDISKRLVPNLQHPAVDALALCYSKVKSLPLVHPKHVVSMFILADSLEQAGVSSNKSISFLEGFGQDPRERTVGAHAYGAK